MKSNPLPRLDTDEAIRQQILPFCRLHPGETWADPNGQHKVACIDAADTNAVLDLMDGKKADLAIHDPPYNLVAFEERELNEYIRWCNQWGTEQHHNSQTGQFILRVAWRGSAQWFSAAA